MSDGTIYNDQRGPLDLSTAAREQELFYCEFTQEQIEQIRTAFGCLYTHLRAHETKANLVCRLLLEKKKKKKKKKKKQKNKKTKNK